MTRLRNVLMMYGAVAIAAWAVRLAIASVSLPRAWTGEGTDTRTIVWFLGSTCVSAALGGLLAGAAFDGPKSVGWTLLLAAFAGLESSPLVSWKVFSSFPAWASVTFAAWTLAMAVSAGCFHIVTPGRAVRME